MPQLDQDGWLLFQQKAKMPDYPLIHVARIHRPSPSCALHNAVGAKLLLPELYCAVNLLRRPSAHTSYIL